MLNEVQMYTDEDYEYAYIRWNDGSVTMIRQQENNEVPYVHHWSATEINRMYSVTTKRGLVGEDPLKTRPRV